MELEGRVNGLTFLEGGQDGAKVSVMRASEHGDVVLTVQRRYKTVHEALKQVSDEFGYVVVYEMFPEMA